MKRRKPAALCILVVICFLVLMWPLEGNIEAGLNRIRPQRAGLQIGGDLPGIYRFFQLAGLNALLADILWMKADDLWHSSSWWQMAPVMESIVRIDPKFIMAWRVLAWHYGWNLHAASRSRVEQVYWLEKSADAYDRATTENPDNFDLWWDMCWFYTDRLRRYDKAVPLMEKGVAKFPTEIDTLERCLQHTYERTWRVADAVRVIRDIKKKRPQDTLAHRDLDWWKKHHDDVDWRWVLEVREQIYRQKRNLPMFRNPFEGSVVSSPPWRDWEAPLYMNQEWEPNIIKYQVDSVWTILDVRPDLAEKYMKAHPELMRPPKPTGKPRAGKPRPSTGRGPTGRRQPMIPEWLKQ